MIDKVSLVTMQTCKQLTFYDFDFLFQEAFCTEIKGRPTLEFQRKGFIFKKKEKLKL